MHSFDHRGLNADDTNAKDIAGNSPEADNLNADDVSRKKKKGGTALKAAVIAAAAVILLLALDFALYPCTFIRSDIRAVTTGTFDDVYLGTSHG